MSQSNAVIRFGPFEADTAAGQLRKHGLRVRIQDQPFIILTVFLQHPGAIVTREQLRSRLWPEGVFVDFDNSLNAAINKLREALGDSADNPRYVETLPRRGYRFIGAVENGSGYAGAGRTGPAISGGEREAPRDEAAALAGPAVQPGARVSVEAGAQQASSQQARAGAAAKARLGARTAGQALPRAAVAAVVMTLLLGSGYVLRRWLWPPAAAYSSRTMLAVLPFKNLSGDAKQDYLSDGLTEELLLRIGRLQPERLGVIARTSAMQDREGHQGIPQIARELGVQYALEGSVRRSADRVRVTVQLVDTRGQAPLWAASYERDVRDVLAIQQDVAAHVARALAIELLPAAPGGAGARRVGSAPTTGSPEAFEAYLQGRYHWQRRSPEGMKLALNYFQKAIAADPEYALAWAGLADCYTVMSGSLTGLRPPQAYAEAKAAVDKALALDPTLAEAYVARAAILFEHEWDFPAAERAIQRGLELNPSYAMGHQWYAEYLAAWGRREEALLEIKRSLALDPYSRSGNLVYGQILMYSGRLDEAERVFLKLVEMDPQYTAGVSHLARVYRQMNRPDDWFASYQKWMQQVGVPAGQIEAYGLAFQQGGMKAALRQRLTDLEPIAHRIYGGAYAVARIRAVLGDTEAALAWLEKAAKERDDFSSHITVDPELDSLRADPRFQALLRRIGFRAAPE